jgi:hypothetical protein
MKVKHQLQTLCKITSELPCTIIYNRHQKVRLPEKVLVPGLMFDAVFRVVMARFNDCMRLSCDLTRRWRVFDSIRRLNSFIMVACALRSIIFRSSAQSSNFAISVSTPPLSSGDRCSIMAGSFIRDTRSVPALCLQGSPSICTATFSRGLIMMVTSRHWHSRVAWLRPTRI